MQFLVVLGLILTLLTIALIGMAVRLFLVKNGEVDITSQYESLHKHKLPGDFRFIVLEQKLSADNSLPLHEKIFMQIYFILKKLSLSEEKGFGLDLSFVTVETVPLLVSPVKNCKLTRIQ